MDDHPWLLIAPWYDWPLTTCDRFGFATETAPIIQKFTPDDFVRTFVSDPQASFTFGPPDAITRDSTPVRKLFQATHGRLYLVTCELVCNTRGLPAPPRDSVCQAGVVIRRRHPAPVAGGPTSQRWSVEAKQWKDVAVDRNDLVNGPDADPDPNELIIAMFPLAPSGGSPHDATDRTMYFAPVPTASSVHDADGRAQFDGTSTYELRCFVRRHSDECPRQNGRRDCRGPLTWSKFSEPFVLADPVDVDGCGQHRVTIAMPDVSPLKALADTRRVPATTKFAAPDGSAMVITSIGGNLPAANGFKFEGADNCYFALPLITIVAKFVLSLFMSILLFIAPFLSWLLGFRFCFPQASLDEAAEKLAALEKSDKLRWDTFLETGKFDAVSLNDMELISDVQKLLAKFKALNPDDPAIKALPTTGPVTDAGLLLKALIGILEATTGPKLVPRERVTREQVGLR